MEPHSSTAQTGNDRVIVISKARSEVVIGFSFRKRIRIGPVRLNLSKTGIGVSTGVKGLSVSTGSRGTYLNAGMNGVYYRTKLKLKKLTSKAASRFSRLWTPILF